MILVGIDSIEIERIKKSMLNHKFLEKYFGEIEYLQLKERNFPAQSVAANFCAKEAFLKAFGKGLGEVALKKIELLRKTSGQPYLNLASIPFLEEFTEVNFSVSVTHTRQIATVIVLAEAKCLPKK